MKTELLLGASLLLCSSLVSAESITVSAYVDGTSALIFQGDTVHWHHTAWAAPGRWDGNDYATMINGIDWVPEWPATGRNDFCDCDSSSISGLFTALPHSATTVSLEALDARGPVTILEQPDVLNDFRLVVQFDDFYFGGASWYDVKLTSSPVPLPAGIWLLSGALSALGVARARRGRE